MQQRTKTNYMHSLASGYKSNKIHSNEKKFTVKEMHIKIHFNGNFLPLS